MSSRYVCWPSRDVTDKLEFYYAGGSNKDGVIGGSGNLAMLSPQSTCFTDIDCPQEKRRTYIKCQASF